MAVIRLRREIPGLEFVPPALRSWVKTVVPEEIPVIFPESKEFIKPMPTRM